MNSPSDSPSCALCELPIRKNSLAHKELEFCCHGCLSVYQILESISELASKKDHPLLKQAIQFGLISNPELIEKIQAKGKQEPLEKTRWIVEIGEMWCPACATLIQLALGGKEGMIKCMVDYMTDLASIEFDPCQVSKEQIQNWIKSLGYKVHEISSKEDEVKNSSLTFRFTVAAFSALNIMMFAYPLYATYFDWDVEGLQPTLAWVSFLFTLPVMLYSGFPIYQRMWVQLTHGYLAMEALVGIGTLSAFLLSLIEMIRGTYHIYFDTIAVIITFILLGKMIESKAKFSTKNALTRLHRALPRKGRKQFADGTASFVPMKEIQIGDCLAAYSGERIVLDGKIVQGEGACDESIVTGEMRPILKKEGDTLLAGSILQNGALTYAVTSPEEDSTLKKILHLVEKEIGHKSHFVGRLDSLVKWFTPFVIVIALMTFCLSLSLGFEESIRRFLAILMIACPCAIGIAAPLVESRLMQRFSEKGAIVRNRSLLSLLSQVTHFVFDKTGTITQGQFKVLNGLDTLSSKERQILKGLSSQSIHPVSQAVNRSIKEEPVAFSKIQEINGRGVRGTLNGEEYFLGSFAFAKEMGLNSKPPEDSTVYFFNQSKVLTTLLLGDEIREGVFEMLNALPFAKKILLSGDHSKPVSIIASKFPFDLWYAEKTPLEKQKIITDLKKKGAYVCMVGDGINDAPALAKADVGVSIVSGADISIQVSDLLLMEWKGSTLPELTKLAAKGNRLIHQNLFWAFAYNMAGIIFAALGILTPLFASFAMIVSSLIVILNAKRI